MNNQGRMYLTKTQRRKTMKTMTDRVANKVAGTWNKTYSIGPDRVSLRVEHIESRLFTDQVGGMGDALKRKISSTKKTL